MAARPGSTFTSQPIDALYDRAQFAETFHDPRDGSSLILSAPVSPFLLRPRFIFLARKVYPNQIPKRRRSDIRRQFNEEIFRA